MAERIASLYAEIGAETSGLEAGLKRTQDGIGGVMGSFTELSSAIGLVKQGAQVVGEVFSATVGKTIEYADQVRGLSQSFSITAEEASKLIQVGDDLGVSADTLKTAFRGMAQNGIAPSLDSLKALGAQYRAIQDPAERAQFALKNFGRAGLEFSPILLADASAMDASAKSAQQTGQIMSGEAVASARAYSVAVDNLTDSWEGFVYTLSGKVIPALTESLNYINEHQTNVKLLQDALDSGRISQIDYANTIDMTSGAGVKNNDVMKLIKAQAIEVSDSFDRATGTTRNFGDALSDSDAAMTKAMADAGNLADSVDKYTLAVEAANNKTELAAGLGGQVGQASKDYADTQAGLADDIAKTTAELDKYTKLQGQTVTVTTEAKASTLDLANAQFDAETAAIRIADAQKKLNENTDPDKTRQLQGALLDAQVAAEGAASKVNKLSGEMGSSDTVTLNYNTKIGELKGHLADLQGQADEAQAHMHELTNEFIFQQASAGLDAGAALELARSLGLIDEQTYTTSKSLDDLKGKYDTNRDGAISAAEAANGYTGAVSGLAGVIAQLQDKHITVTVDTINRQISENGVTSSGTSGQVTNPNSGAPRTGFASGVDDFIVPPGFPNDSYKIGLTSGERVSVNPDGQGGTGKAPIIGQVVMRSNDDIELLARKVATYLNTGAY